MVEKHRKHCNILYYITVENLIRFIWYFRMHRLFIPPALFSAFLGKPLAYGSARLGHIPSLPGNRNCPWNLVSHYNLSIFEGNCNSLLDFTYGFLCSLICSANVGCSPTPRQHFWKTAAPKNFLFACGSLLAVMRFWCNVSCETFSGCTFNKFWKNGGN